MKNKAIALLALAAIIAVAGCLGGDDEAKKFRCPLSTTNPLDCRGGILLVETADGCRVMMCSDQLNGSQRIIQDLSKDYPMLENETTLGESERIARDYVLSSAEYVGRNGYNIILIDTIADSCRYCWTFTYNFKAESSAHYQVISEYNMTVSVRRGTVNETNVTEAIKTCDNTDECVSADAPIGVQITCEENKCIKRTLANPATGLCISSGGRSEIRKDANGNQAGYCVFRDSSECEEWAYYRGECSKGQNPINCYEFEGASSCPQDLDPVCAKIESGTGEPIDSEWKTFDNACMACTSRSRLEVVVGYKRGNCSAYGTAIASSAASITETEPE